MCGVEQNLISTTCADEYRATYLVACSYQVLFQNLASLVRMAYVLKCFCSVATSLAEEDFIAAWVLSIGKQRVPSRGVEETMQVDVSCRASHSILGWGASPG